MITHHYLFGTTNIITIIIHKRTEESFSTSNALILKILNNQSIYYKTIDDLALFEVGGLFVRGSNGLTFAALEALRQSKINIEYQLMNPNRYSILIKKNTKKKALKCLTKAMSIRDNMVSVYD